MIKTFIHNLLIRFFSLFIKERKEKILFLPNQVSSYNFVDIENYTHESVLTYLHFLITDEIALKNKKHEYVLVVYQEYQKFLPVPKDEKGIPLFRILYSPVVKKSLKHAFVYYKEYFSSHVIISGDPMRCDRYKRKSQIEIDLSYYVAFKSDYLRRPKKDSNLNYVITSSNIAAQIDSLATRVPFPNYIPLGLPKWDNITKPRFTKDELVNLLGYLNKDSIIIIYTPTHRDYEQKEGSDRGFLGANKDYDDLNELLKCKNAFLIVKPHPKQNLKIIKNLKNYSNIKIYESTRNYTIHDILAYADFLITDYTSVYFDYIVKPRPTLFYLYDMEKYNNSRGLSWNPVDSICNGNICYTYEMLIENIKLFLDNKYPFDKEKYKLIQSLVLGNNNTHGVCNRVYNFMLEHI